MSTFGTNTYYFYTDNSIEKPWLSLPSAEMQGEGTPIPLTWATNKKVRKNVLLENLAYLHLKTAWLKSSRNPYWQIVKFHWPPFPFEQSLRPWSTPTRLSTHQKALFMVEASPASQVQWSLRRNYPMRFLCTSMYSLNALSKIKDCFP